MTRRIMVYAQEAGAAAVLEPVIRHLHASRDEVEVTAAEPALNILSHNLRDLGVRVLRYGKSVDYSAQLVVTGCGTARVPENRNVVTDARRRNIHVLGVLDNWKGFERFFEPDGSLAEDSLPDTLAVMDTATRDSLRDMGIPMERMIVTGHPYEGFWKPPALAEHHRLNARMSLGIRNSERACVLISEPLHNHSFYEPCTDGCGPLFQMDAGSVNLFDRIRSEAGSGSCFIYRSHPSIGTELLPGSHVLRADEPDIRTLIASADCVYGLSAMPVQLSVMAGRPTVNVASMLTDWSPKRSFIRPEIWAHLSAGSYLRCAGPSDSRRPPAYESGESITGLIERLLARSVISG